MTTPVFETKRERTILERVHEGMRVFDADNQLLGTVDGLYLGEVNSQEQEQGHTPATVSTLPDASDSLVNALRRAFGKEGLPDELRSRLLQNGFVHVNIPGILAHDRYVMPDQIVQVTTEGIVLRAKRGDLIKDT